MKRLLAASVLLSSATALAMPAGRAPQVLRPTASELERALARHDDVELERLGERFGAVRLFALVDHGSPEGQKAALAALELVDGSLAFVPKLVGLADRDATDPKVAAAITASVRRICERVPRGELNLDELPADVPRAAVDALATLAGREVRAVPERIDAVVAMAALLPLAPNANPRLAALADTRDADVRRAVVDALPAAANAPILARTIATDVSSPVALAAAASLCRDIPPPGAEKKGERSLERAAALPADARARLRTLAVDAALPENDRLDVLPCLRSGAQKPDQRSGDAEVLRTLAKGADGALKKRARAYGAR